MRMWSPAGSPVLIALLALGGCFGSENPVIGPEDSVMLFGEGGAARRVSIGWQSGPQNQPVRFEWDDAGYRVVSDHGADPLHYRLTRLEARWFIWQSSEPRFSVYGLARQDGARLWTYAPDCAELPDETRARLGLTLGADGVCPVSDLRKLRAVLRTYDLDALRPNGYFELTPEVRP